MEELYSMERAMAQLQRRRASVSSSRLQQHTLRKQQQVQHHLRQLPSSLYTRPTNYHLLQIQQRREQHRRNLINALREEVLADLEESLTPSSPEESLDGLEPVGSTTSNGYTPGATTLVDLAGLVKEAAPQYMIPSTATNAATTMLPYLLPAGPTIQRRLEEDDEPKMPSSEQDVSRRRGTFPQKLHRMLLDLEQTRRTDIACFLPSGQGFVIFQPDAFVNEILPKYFRMTRYSSFQRQLNLYDFIRQTHGSNKGSYHHQLFQRHKPELCFMMKRIKVKNTKNRLGPAFHHMQQVMNRQMAR